MNIRNSETQREVLTALLIAGMATAAAALTAGCNTTEGVGEDIEAAGDAIDDAAEDAND